MGEITADEILDMPIVFADESPQEDIQLEPANTSYFITNVEERKMVVKEELVDEDENLDVVCPTVSRSAVTESLKIKQVSKTTVLICDNV